MNLEKLVIGAKREIAKKYIPVVLTFLTVATVTGTACNKDSNTAKIPDSNTPTAGQVVPENRATMEQTARVEEIKKVRDMFEEHNPTPALKSKMDSFWSALPALPLSEYENIIRIDSSSGQTTYAINYHTYDNSSNVTMLILNSYPKNNSTIERLDILTDKVPAADMNDSTLIEHLNTSFGDMQKTSGHEWSAPSPDFPNATSVYNAGYVVDEKAPVPGTFSMAAHIISDGGKGEEVLTHVYVKANPNTSLKSEAPVEVINPLFSKLEQALGEKWIDISYTAGHILNDRLYPGANYPLPKPLTGLEEDFCARAYNSLDFDRHAGFSLSPKNFIPNVEVDYVQGKDYFTGMYGMIFTPDQVNNLYNFVKEDIFKGKEY